MFDSITIANNYFVADVVIGGMQTSDQYSSDAKIAILTNSATGNMEDMFHTLDCARVFHAFADNKTTLTSRDHNEVVYTIYSKDESIAVDVLLYHVVRGETNVYVADIDFMNVEVRITESDETFEDNYNRSIGFKANNSTGYFIEEVKAVLEGL